MAVKKNKEESQMNSIKYLLSIGFKPITDKPDETLYKKNNYVICVSLERTIDDIKKELKNYMGPNYESIPEDKTEVQADAADGGKDEVPEGETEYDPFMENSEPVEPFFVAEEVKDIATPVFRRLTLDGNRFYYRQMDDGNVKIYASGTTLIKDGYADSKDQLFNWKKGLELIGQNPEEVAQYEADKGTIMHYLYGLYLTGRDIYLDKGHIVKLIDEGNLAISKKNLNRFKESCDDIDNMIERLCRFAKFCQDYKVRPIFIEKILSCEEYEVASPIDCICWMSVMEKEVGYFGAVYKTSGRGYKAGDPKMEERKVERTFAAIVDFKSGNIYPGYALQLELYRRMVKEWFGDKLHIEKLYNFSPKSESSKGYTLRDQTNNKEIQKADYVFGQGMINHKNKEKIYKIRVGKLNINDSYNEDEHIKVFDIATELTRTFK